MDTGHRSNDRTLMSQINVTPFVDVMLVLLVIFMITAPMMQQGLQVNLPKADTKALNIKEEPVVVSIDRNGKAYIDRLEVPAGQLKGKLDLIFTGKTKKEVFLKADRNVPYGDVIRTMAEIKSAGVERLGMLTEPAQQK